MKPTVLALILAMAAAEAGPVLAAPAPAAPFDAAIGRAKSAMMADPEAALAASRQALALAGHGPGDLALRTATAQWLEAEALIRVDQAKTALPIIEQALKVSAQRAPRGKLHGDLMTCEGEAMSALGDVQKALEDYQGAFNIYGAAGDPRGQAKVLQSIGSIYQDARDYERVLKYYAQSADTYKADPALLVSALNNKADAFKELGRYDEAIAAFRSALGVAREMRSASLQANIYSNLASAEVKAGRLADAGADVQRGLALAAAAPEEQKGLWGVAAEVAMKRGRLQQARQLLERTFAGVDLKTTTMGYRDFHEAAWQTYSALGEDHLALEHLAAFKRLDDDARNLAASTNAALMAARFDFANQDLKISKLKQGELQRDVELGRQHNTITTGLLGGSALILVLLTLGFISLRRSRNEVRAANVSLRSSNQALEKALKAKTDFLATTSHEIRTPLNGILGMTQVLLADRKLEEGLKDKIALVHGAGETMRALVDDILDLAKMETGNLTIERTDIDLRSIMDETGRLWAEKARGKGLELAVSVEDGLHRIVEDGGRLRQILFNLMSNAIKFTESGQVRLTARSERAEAGERLMIEVCDTGIGIPRERFEDIFDSFSQVDTSVTRQYGGTGLGLAICRDLAEAMGGSIGVASELGQGSVFTVILPLRRGAEADVPEAAAQARGRACELGDCRLLIVEANPLAQSVLRGAFAPKVRDLEIIASADEALEALRLGVFDHVLADGAAMGASEVERLQRLSSLSQASPTPVSVMWPSPDEALQARILKAGAAQVLAKPITPADLAAALGRWFARAADADEVSAPTGVTAC
jgi:signal transduction histidine kinase/ActR/RegA family two-component response regulator